MLGLSALNSSTPGMRAQLTQYQAQLQQARRDAAQAAERVARLEEQAEQARQQSDRADERVRGLEGQAPRTTSGYNRDGDRTGGDTPARRSGQLLDTQA